ncbi:MAG: hypothetical protein ACK5QT_01060 [Oligoflexia bacterium]
MKRASEFSFLGLGVWVLWGVLISPSFGQQTNPPSARTQAEQVFERMRSKAEDALALRELSKELWQQPVSDLLSLRSEFERLSLDPRISANIRRVTARLWLRVADRALDQRVGLFDSMRAAILTAEKHDDFIYTHVRSTLLHALGDSIGQGDESFQERVQSLLREAALSGVPGSDVAVRMLASPLTAGNAQAQAANLDLMLRIASEPKALSAARGEALFRLLLSCGSMQGICDEQRERVGSVIFSAALSEAELEHPDLGVLSKFVQALTVFSNHSQRTNMAQFMSRLQSDARAQEPILRDAIYDGLVVFSDIPEVLRLLLTEQAKKGTLDYHALAEARSKVLYLRDRVLDLDQKIQIWDELLAYLAQEERVNRRTAVLRGLRLSWSLQIVPGTISEITQEWVALPIFLQKLRLMEIPRRNVTIDGLMLLRVLSGGIAMLVDPTGTLISSEIASSGQQNQQAYANLHDDLKLDASELQATRAVITRMLRAKKLAEKAPR